MTHSFPKWTEYTRMAYYIAEFSCYYFSEEVERLSWGTDRVVCSYLGMASDCFMRFFWCCLCRDREKKTPRIALRFPWRTSSAWTPSTLTPSSRRQTRHALMLSICRRRSLISAWTLKSWERKWRCSQCVGGHYISACISKSLERRWRCRPYAERQHIIARTVNS